MSNHLFTITPKAESDVIQAQQLEAIFNTDTNVKAYQQMVHKSISDLINYGKLPDKQEEQTNE